MANEIQYRHSNTGDTLYIVVVNATPGDASLGKYWDATAGAWDTPVVADWGDYDIAMTETPASSYNYLGSFPSAITAEGNTVLVFRRIGSSVAIGDQLLATGAFYWTGTQEQLVPTLAADALDNITVTEPTTVATTFPGMLVQLFRRFFKKTTMTSTQIKTHKDDGTTVVTTQTIADDGTTQTQGASS